MKKTIIMMLGVATLASLNSCFTTEEDIFEQSTAQRLEAANKENKDALTGAENGWVIEYFANQYEQAYPVLAKFYDNGGVTMAANNDATTGGVYKEASSTYSLGSDTGPILSFDTWNDVFSGFADPSADGLGHEGDYEFIVTRISADKDTIYLTGKKHGLKMRMVKFPMGAEYTAADGTTAKVEKWEDYYTAYSAVQSHLFNSKVSTLYLASGDTRYVITGMNSGIFTFVPEGGDESAAVALPYCLGLDNSVNLLDAYTGAANEISVQSFKLADDGLLKSADAKYVISCGSLADMFGSAVYKWRISRNNDLMPDNITGEYATAVQNLIDAVRSYRRPNNFQYLQFSYSAATESYMLNLRTSRHNCEYYFDMEFGENNTVKLKYRNEANGNGQAYYDDLAAVKSLISLLESQTFTMSGNSVLTTTEIVLTSSVGAIKTAIY